MSLLVSSQTTGETRGPIIILVHLIFYICPNRNERGNQNQPSTQVSYKPAAVSYVQYQGMSPCRIHPVSSGSMSLAGGRDTIGIIERKRAGHVYASPHTHIATAARTVKHEPTFGRWTPNRIFFTVCWHLYRRLPWLKTLTVRYTERRLRYRCSYF